MDLHLCLKMVPFSRVREERSHEIGFFQLLGVNRRPKIGRQVLRGRDGSLHRPDDFWTPSGNSVHHAGLPVRRVGLQCKTEWST